ncbi:MAG TPA: hypothetical protein VMR73_00885 [Candidatus Paceibacterota bacterium]|nr:hypothetical protein [Candidatus Paceibacterota bacterium]
MLKIFSRFVVIVSTLLILFALPVEEIQASVVGTPYFGGIVIAQHPCNTGFLLYVKDALPVPPFFEIIPYMWFWGELPFLFHIPPHVGQELLGAAGPTPVACFLGYAPTGEVGFPIIYHGDSL